MNRLRWQQAGALGGIGYVVLQIASQVLVQIGMAEPPFSAPAETIAAFFASKNSQLGEIGAFLVGLSIFAFLWFLGALWGVLREAEEEPAWLSLTAALSGALAMATIYSNTGWHLAIFRAAEGLDPQIARLLFDSGNLSFANMWVALASMLVAAGVVILRSAALPRWIGWLGIVTAVGLLAARAVWAGPGVVFVPYMGFWVWLITVSVSLMRQASRV